MKRPRAAVIGSGFGGLALAIRLQAAGIQTTVVEQRARPGGRAYVYEDQGFTFDAGPTVITAPNTVQELFELGARQMSDYVELIRVQPFYRLCWEDGYTFDYSDDLELTNAQIARKSLDDVEGYARFLDYAEEVFQEGYVKLAHVPFLNFSSMVRVAPPSCCGSEATAASTIWSPVSSAIHSFARLSASTPCWSEAIPLRPLPSIR